MQAVEGSGPLRAANSANRARHSNPLQPSQQYQGPHKINVSSDTIWTEWGDGASSAPHDTAVTHHSEPLTPHPQAGVGVSAAPYTLTPPAVPQAEVEVSTTAHKPPAAFGMRETTAACLEPWYRKPTRESYIVRD
jgi:hypothetical protein